MRYGTRWRKRRPVWWRRGCCTSLPLRGARWIRASAVRILKLSRAEGAQFWPVLSLTGASATTAASSDSLRWGSRDREKSESDWSWQTLNRAMCGPARALDRRVVSRPTWTALACPWLEHTWLRRQQHVHSLATVWSLRGGPNADQWPDIAIAAV